MQAKCDQQFEGYWCSNERNTCAKAGVFGVDRKECICDEWVSRVDKDDGDLKDHEYRSQRGSIRRRVYFVDRKVDGALDIGALL